MKEIKARTELAVIASRVFVNGDQDLPAAGYVTNVALRKG